MPDLLYEVRGAAAWLTLNRPERRHAIGGDMLALFDQHLDAAQADPAVRAVVVTGAGERVFCAGADLSSAFDDAGALTGPQHFARVLTRLLIFPKPVIARVNGHCLAGGTGLLAACDMAYARDDATFGTPEVQVGVFPMLIAPFLLRCVPRKRVLEMVYTGRRYSAAEAAQMGLITRALPADDLDAEVERAVTEIAGNGPAAIAIGRPTIEAVADLPLAEALPLLHERLMEVVGTEDAAEGLAAFLERRKPVWRGR